MGDPAVTLLARPRAYPRTMWAHDLRMFARAVPLVVIVILSIHISGQEHDEGGYYMNIGCPDRPRDSSAVSLEVAKAWVEDNSLFADLFVTNNSELAIRLPRANGRHRYWHARIASPPEPITTNLSAYVEEERGCLPHATLWSEDVPVEFIEEQDIETIAPGRTVSLRVYLGSFSSDPQKTEQEVRHFRVTYDGAWSPRFYVVGEAQRAKKALTEAVAAECSLYHGQLSSIGHFLTP